MVFSSLQFIFIFLPIFFLTYSIANYKLRNLIILIFSMTFYWYGVRENPYYLVFFALSILINYMVGILITKRSHAGKLWLSLGIIYNMGILFMFKYANFFMNLVDSAIALPENIKSLTIFNLSLPIGISFYTFQATSYIIDVYRGSIKKEKSLINFGAYISMFPQLIAGPIVTYDSIRKYLTSRKYTLQGLSAGSKTFILGLGLKVLLANPMGSLWTTLGNIGYESISSQLAWIGMYAKSFQIYFDFLGYSLMAIGLGRMIGIKLPHNFAHPYLATSMIEFWRRWHITLGSWFREYVYIPLGGNREGELKTYRNLFVVWLFTGLWHGASLNFLIWGLILCLIIVIERAVLYKPLTRFSLLGHIYMIFLIPVSWVVFSITDFHQMRIYYSKLFPVFSGGSEVIFKEDYIKYFMQNWYIFLACILFSTKLPFKLYAQIKNSIIGELMLLIVFWVSIYLMYIGLDDPFLYFRF